MCIFSGNVSYVGKTKIFARVEGDKQYLAYAMDVKTTSPVAMILPLPTKQQVDETGFSFINLEAIPDFFDLLEAAFPTPKGLLGPMRSRSLKSMQPLPVHDVGDFVASFVPRLEDFARVDEQFRMPQNVWSKLPHYSDFSFAVFQLKSQKSPIEAPPGGMLLDELEKQAQPTRRIHPMAFSFVTRYPSSLFYPTVHVHAGDVPVEEEFDHTLYSQGTTAMEERSSSMARNYVAVDKTQGLIDGDKLLSRRTVSGNYPNRDIYVPVVEGPVLIRS